MFTYGSDIAILHGTLLSIEKEELSISSAVDLIEKQVRLYCVSHNNNAENAIRRMHAALFVSLIRVPCEEKDAFESVNDLFGSLNWELYFHILYKLDWRIYFLECMSQIEDAVFQSVLQQALNHASKSEEACNAYVNFCLIQAKLVGRKSSGNISSIYEHAVNIITNKYQPLENLYYHWTLQTFRCLAENILTEIAHSKVHIHCLYFPIENETETLTPQSLILTNIFIQHQDIINALCDVLERSPPTLEKPIVWDCLATFNNLTRCIRLLKDRTFYSDEFDQIQIIKYKLEQMLPKKNYPDQLDLFHLIKSDILEVKDICYKLKEEACSERNDLEYHLATITIRDTLKALLMALKKKSLSVKNYEDVYLIFLSVFCEHLPNLSFRDKMNLVCNILGTEGRVLKLRTYKKLLTTFLNQAVDEDFQAKLLYLCLQSPTETVYNIMDHIVYVGGQMSVSVKMLAFMEPICKWTGNDGNKVFTEILQYYINSSTDFQSKEKRNFVNLLKEIFQLDDEFSIIDQAEVMELLLGNIEPKRKIEILELNLELLNELFISMNKRGLLIRNVSKYPLMVLVMLFCKLMAIAMQRNLLYQREKILDCLESLRALCTKEDLTLSKMQDSYLKENLHAHPDITKIMVADFFDYSISLFKENNIRGFILCACAKVELKIPSKIGNLRTLVPDLTKILVYITKEEWIRAFKFLIQIADYLPSFLPEKGMEYFTDDVKPTNKNKVLSIFVQAVIMLAQSKRTCNWSYLMSAFTALIQEIFLGPDKTTNEISLAASSIVQMVNELCTIRSYAGNMRDLLSTLFLHLVDQFRSLPSDENSQKLLEIFISMLKDDLIMRTVLPNITQEVNSVSAD